MEYLAFFPGFYGLANFWWLAMILTGVLSGPAEAPVSGTVD
jgi:hypothetical protein